MSTTPPTVLPPHLAVAGLLVELALHRWLPLHRMIWPPVTRLGWLLIAAGIGLALWAVRLFRRADTGVRPFSPSTHLVVEGPYRFTRNPMYLGMLLVLIGTAVLLGTLTPLFVPPLFVAVITTRFIEREEAHLEAAFGAEYLELKDRVRRWL